MTNESHGREGLPMPQEPAYAAERSQDGGAKAASERAKNRMFVASVRRRGMGSPELPPQEVDLLGNRRVCGDKAVGRMRSMRTTARRSVRATVVAPHGSRPWRR